MKLLKRLDILAWHGKEKILVLLFYIQLNIEIQRGEVFGQLMIDRLRLFFILK